MSRPARGPRTTIVPLRLLLVAILVVTASTQPVFLLGAAFPQMGPELGFGPTGLGFLTGAFFLTSAAASIPLGRLIDRIGWRTAMRVNAVVSGLLVVAIGLGARDLVSLTLLLVASAAAYGASNPAANKALAAQGAPRRRALVFGLKHAGIPTSALLAGLAVPTLVVTLGWRAAYLVAAVVPVLVLALVPKEAAPPADDPADGDDRRHVEPLGRRQLAALAAGSALATWAPVALSTYLVAAAVALGFSPSAAGLLLFAGSAVSILARVLAGALTDHIGGRGFAGVATLTAAGAVVLLALAPSTGTMFALLVLVAFATGWGWPGLMTYAVVNANTGTVAASSAITQAGVFLGAGVGPLILGWTVGRYGFSAIWLVAAAGLAVSTATVGAVGAHATRVPRSPTPAA